MDKAITTLLVIIIITGTCYFLYSKEMLPIIGAKPAEQATSEPILTDNESADNESADNETLPDNESVADIHNIEAENLPTPKPANLPMHDYALNLLSNNINMGRQIADALRLHSPEAYQEISSAEDELGAVARLSDYEREGGVYINADPYSVYASTELGRRMIADNHTKGAEMLNEAGDKGLIEAQLALISHYEKIEDKANLCAAVEITYEEYGFEAFSAGLIYKDQKPDMDTLLTCGILPADTLDAFDSAEAHFLQAQVFIAEGNFEEAMKLLEMDETNTPEPAITAALENNRLFCRAMLTYLGLGVEADKETGLSMLKTSYENGQLAAGVKLAEFGEIMENEFFPLPETDMLTDYYTNVCSFDN